MSLGVSSPALTHAELKTRKKIVILRMFVPIELCYHCPMNLPNTLDAYDFFLPKELIAERPVFPRDHSKLLVFHESEDRLEHKNFYDIQDYLNTHDTLFFNNSKVFPSRLFGTKESGGKAEVLLIEPRAIEGKYLVMLRSNGKKNISDIFHFQGLTFEVVDNLDQGK